MALTPKVRSLALVIVSAVILFFGLWLIVPDRTVAPTNSVQTQVSEISYTGVEGKNALDLLKSSHKVETQSSAFGEFVQSIDGVTADSSHFWAFYVNGALADVGAGSYATNNSDQITWKLDAIQ